MKAIALSPLIGYLAGEDDKGHVGVMVFKGNAKHPRTVVSIESQSDFRFYFTRFREMEQKGFSINVAAGE